VAGTTGTAGSTGGAHSLQHLALPAKILERLGRNGIRSCLDWGRLSRKQRRAIWGVTAAMVREVDRAVAQAQK
jgi:hypothetical protein